MESQSSRVPAAALRPKTTDILGVPVSLVNISTALECIAGWVETGTRSYVCVTGVHGVMESQSDGDLKRIHRDAGLVVPDGMPLVWISRARGFDHVERCYGPDLMLAAFAESPAHNWRHFLYGGGDGVADLLASRLGERFPEAEVVGTYTPPFRPLTDAEEREVEDRINSSGADLVWVGLSTPKQERWMASHVGRLNAAALLGVGAAFDFHAGLKPQAPGWMQRNGLEWLFRTLSEPRRLGPRYLKNNPAFIWRMARENLMGPSEPR